MHLTGWNLQHDFGKSPSLPPSPQKKNTYYKVIIMIWLTESWSEHWWSWKKYLALPNKNFICGFRNFSLRTTFSSGQLDQASKLHLYNVSRGKKRIVIFMGSETLCRSVIHEYKQVQSVLLSCSKILCIGRQIFLHCHTWPVYTS